MKRHLLKTTTLLSMSILLQSCVISSSSSIISSIASSLTLSESSLSEIISSILSSASSSSTEDLYWCIHTGSWLPEDECVVSSSASSVFISSLESSSSDSFSEVSSSISSSVLESSSSYSSLQSSSSYISSVALELPVFYSSASGLTGTALKQVLNDLIDYHTRYPYTSDSTDVWDILKVTDEDPNNTNNVIGIYTQRSIPKLWQDGSSSACNNDCWNREHVWSKSHGDFDTVLGPGTDAHHLRAADKSVNSTKNNDDFDDIVPHSVTNQVTDLRDDGSRTPISAWSIGEAFEPADNVKGDIARMILYMDVRYDGTEGYPDLVVVEATSTDSGIYSQGSTYGYYGRLSTLLRWNELDPVDDYERSRHEKIVGFQGNRNPFVDFPQFANLIWR